METPEADRAQRPSERFDVSRLQRQQRAVAKASAQRQTPPSAGIPVFLQDLHRDGAANVSGTTCLALNALDLAAPTRPAASDDPMQLYASALSLDGSKARDHAGQSHSQLFVCYICEQHTRYQLKCQVCADLSCPMCQECFEELHSGCTQDQGADLTSAATPTPNQWEPAQHTMTTQCQDQPPSPAISKATPVAPTPAAGQI